jgi:glycosyltransferase involved in cell wall biosynthesis
MRIAVIEPGQLPAQTANSIQRMKMAQALAAAGHSVRVFAPGADPHVSWAEFARHYGLRTQFELEWIPIIPALRKYDFAIKAHQRARAWGADLLYTRSPQAATWAAQRGMASIFELHDIPMGMMGPWLLRRFVAAPGARRLVANTQFLANKLAVDFALPQREDFLLVAPNGVDMERYTNLPATAEACKQLGLREAFTVGYTGHLYAGRGVELILNLARALPDMQFLLVGGREADVQRTRQQAAALPNVILTGFVPNAELPRYQAAADILIMPYSQQVAGSSGGDIAPFLNPMKMFEYLASGRPIVSSDLPILREVLTDENAVIVPANEAAWAGALQNLAGDVAKRDRLAIAARRTAEQHTWDERAQRLLAGLL